MPRRPSENWKAFLRSDPKILEACRKIVEFYENKADDFALNHGWEWWEVEVVPSLIMRLINAGIIKVVDKTSRKTRYSLVVPLDELKREVTLAESSTSMPMYTGPEVEEVEEGDIPKDLFKPIVGYDDVKKLFIRMIKSKLPIHILMVGPPATSKTLFMLELARLNGSFYALGSRSSKAGLAELLIEARPKFLIIDEIDKMDWKDQSILLSVMETGIVSLALHGKKVQVTVPVKVVGGCNTLSTLDPALISRFMVLHFKPYDPENFKKVVVAVLTQREGVRRELAEYIAQQISKYTRDPRDAIKIARLNPRDKTEVDEIVEILFKKYGVPRGLGVGRWS